MGLRNRLGVSDLPGLVDRLAGQPQAGSRWGWKVVLLRNDFRPAGTLPNLAPLLRGVVLIRERRLACASISRASAWARCADAINSSYPPFALVARVVVSS